jgi:hypothetical protein
MSSNGQGIEAIAGERLLLMLGKAAGRRITV